MLVSFLSATACGGQGSAVAPTPAEHDSDVPEVVIAVDDPLTADEAPLISEDDGTVTVSTVAHLLHAIRSNRTIRMMPGTYHLDSVEGQQSDHVRWEKVHDGQQLVIDGVENLTLVAATAQRPKILAKPRYAFVLRFVNVKNVTLDKLVLGHTPEGGCTGGVVELDNAQSVQISDSDLFGSGTVGLSLKNVNQFRFERSSVRECTYGIATFDNATDVLFSDSKFIENEQFDLVELHDSPGVRFQRCEFEKNRTTSGTGYVFFKIDAKSSVVLDQSIFEDNEFDRLTNDKRRLKIVGGGPGVAQKQLNKPDPQYNQIYALARYRKWIVAATQAGIVFWDPSTGTVDKLVKAYISGDMMVRGKHLWAGTYRQVIRFDGLKSKKYLRSQKTRGARLIAGPGGKLLLKQNKLVQQPNHWWEYQSKRDRFAPLTVSGQRHAPSILGGGSFFIFHDVLVRNNGEVWGIDFLKALVKSKRGKTTRIPIKGAYPGTDPRRLYEDRRRRLWVIDFGSGFLRLDDATGKFIANPTVSAKGSDMVVDVLRNRTWLLHYTQGLYLEQPGGKVKPFDLSRLKYMRALLLDKDGSVWVGGWNALVHIQRQGASGWRQQSFKVTSASLGPGAGP
jgi:hypothetical protein